VKSSAVCSLSRVGYALVHKVAKVAVQVGDVQSLPWSSNLGSGGGNHDGFGCMSGALRRKENLRLRDKSSASMFTCPGRYCGTSSNWKEASRKNKQRSKCMSDLSQHNLADTAWTAAWLSHSQSTRNPRHECPHAANESSAAKSSLRYGNGWYWPATDIGATYSGAMLRIPIPPRRPM